MANMHSEVQDYLKALLEYYDFTVEKERYISPSDRIDLYGYSKSHNKTIGIEITFTSDVRRDAEKLAKSGFDLIYIVVDNPAYEGKIEYRGRVIPIVHYNSFENELRRSLNISLTFPMFGSFEEWIKGRRIEQIPVAEGKLDKFIQTLRYSGLDEFIEDVINLLAMLYITREIPSMYRDAITYDLICSGVKTKRPQYRTIIEPKILNILKNFDLVLEEARGSGELRKYFIHLTNKGDEIGREIIANRISTNSRELDSIIKEFGKMAPIIAVGTVERYVRERIMRFELSEKDIFDRLLLHVESRVTDYVIHSKLVTMGKEVELRYGRKRKLHPLLSLICYFITYYNYSKSRDFFNRLEELGLAYEVPIYDSRGRFIHDEIRSSIEVSEYILSRIPLPESELIFEFGSLTTILAISRIRDPKIARERLEEYIKFYEIPLDSIKRVLDEFNRFGLASKFIEVSDSGPFLIFDEKKFEEIIKRKLIDTALRFLKL
ncbi:hypothetical protein [Archaeoglobus profundus]|uniref:Uncharacterized protein n=1 Tax=Archaeoglobus profundus (strain DSM 5631 / JCM 9629 / NBRC 100127 / Av18) TaxID=572546 RepID=D2RGV0_ARCPA|nr:hypothetical protein [Archaeoglobus profundus]ADB57525.1 hypothetical protein Arcpr_0459 [Archaeoglobus profundus DSM 5631]